MNYYGSIVYTNSNRLRLVIYQIKRYNKIKKECRKWKNTTCIGEVATG